PSHVAWPPDGRLPAVAGPARADPAVSGLWNIDVATGRDAAATLPAEGTADGLRWSPDGSRLAFTFGQFGRPTGVSGLYVLPRGEQVPRQLLPDGAQFTWTPDSQGITALQFRFPSTSPTGPELRIVTVDASTGTVVATIF